jgi:hypothetical protein
MMEPGHYRGLGRLYRLGRPVAMAPDAFKPDTVVPLNAEARARIAELLAAHRAATAKILLVGIDPDAIKVEVHDHDPEDVA